MTEKSTMHVWPDAWGFRVAECPCDLHLTDYIKERALSDLTLYHFGTGDHHHVGITQGEAKTRNSVIGITASTGEYESYIQLMIRRPELSRWYHVSFGDIYMLNPQMLPNLDLVTLFHLCEYRTEKNDAYGALTDAEVLQLLFGKLRPGGLMMFYPGSYAFAEAKPIIDAWAEASAVEFVEKYKTLLIYRKRADVR